MRRPKVRGARALAAISLPVALVVTVGCVAASSYSVFSAQTASPGNEFTVGSLRLMNDSSGRMSARGAALFSGADVSAGSKPIERCVTVSAAGSVPAQVRLYATDRAGAGQDAATQERAVAVAEHLTVAVDVGAASDTSGGSCADYSPDRRLLKPIPLIDFRKKFDSFDDGLDPGWSSKESRTRTFRFTVEPADDMPTDLQGASTTVDFVWEAVEA